MTSVVSATCSSTVEEPLDLIRLSISEQITVVARGERRITGQLHAYDQHLNMILQNAKETQIVTDIDPITFKQSKRVSQKLNYEINEISPIDPSCQFC
jgi:U6 snRNA-associated Sm-like protein LSm3